MNTFEAVEAHSALRASAILLDPKLPFVGLLGASVAAGALALGWLLLLTIARKWPLDRDHPC